MLSFSQWLMGTLVLGGTLGLVLVATTVVMQRRCAHLSGALRATAFATVATALLLIVHVVPGALGLLSRWTVLAAAAVVMVPVLRLTPVTSGVAPASATPADESTWSWALALVAAGLVTGSVVNYLRVRFGTAPVGIDALTFHLPGAARWMQSHTFWEIDQFTPGLANGNYPNNGDVLLLAVMLPFKSAMLTRGVMAPYFAICGVAIYALAREIGSPRPASLLFASAFCAIPIVAYPAVVEVETDAPMLFSFAAGIAFLIRHRRGGANADFVLAGLALGIAFGTKWYAVPAVALVIAIWLVVSALERRSRRETTRNALLLAGLVAALGGFWLLRNLVESGNPFFPLRLAPLGITIFDAPRDVVRELGGFTISDYLGSPHVLLKYILPAWRHALGWQGLLFGFGVIAASVTALRTRRREDDQPNLSLVIVLAIAAGLLAVVYVFTPDTALGPHNRPLQAAANTRYLIPAFVLGVPLAAWYCGRLRRFRLVFELLAFGLTVQAISIVFPLGSGYAWAIALAVLLACVVSRHIPPPRWLVRPVPLCGLLAAGLVSISALADHRFDYEPYIQADPALAWIVQHAPAGNKIGLAGVWPNTEVPPPFPAFGPRLENRVTYVGPFVRHMLQQYPAGRSFERALERGRYDLLIVGRGFPDPRPTVPAEIWARSIGYRQIVRSGNLTLFRR